MVQQAGDPLNATFSALGDPTRRALLAQLRGGEASVSELAAPFEMSLVAVSKHIKVLEAAGLVARRVEGRTHYLSLKAGPLAAAFEWLAFYRDFWADSLDELNRLLQDDE